MTSRSAREIANDMLKRLLAGERGSLPSQLTMLLEKSSPMKDRDDFYDSVLPPELSSLRLSPEDADQIVASLCQEISRNPDEALISAVSFAGSDLPTKTVAEVLANPPRSLTTSEYAYATSLVSKFLPLILKDNRQFLSEADLRKLIELAKDLQTLEETGPNMNWAGEVKHHSDNLLKGLAHLGIS